MQSISVILLGAVQSVTAFTIDDLKTLKRPSAYFVRCSTCPDNEKWLETEKLVDAAVKDKLLMNHIEIEDLHKSAPMLKTVVDSAMVFLFLESENIPRMYKQDPKPKEIIDWINVGLKQSKTNQNNTNENNKASVLELNDSNFKTEVLNQSLPVFVLMYASWCGHCKVMHPVWKTFAEKANGFKVVSIDADKNRSVGSLFNIRGFPTIKIIPAGSVDGSDAKDYQGSRTLPSLMDAAKAVAIIEPPPTKVIDNLDDLKSSCGEGVGGACIILFLPREENSSKAQRTKYSATLNDALKAIISAKIVGANQSTIAGFRFIQVDEGKFKFIEKTFQLNFGFPAIVAFNATKYAGAVFQGTFESKTIANFIAGIASPTPKHARSISIPTDVDIFNVDGKLVDNEKEEL